MRLFKDNTLLMVLLANAVILVVLASALVFGGILPPFSKTGFPDSAYEIAGFDLRAVTYDDISDWRKDDQSATVPALLRSCERILDLPDDAPVNALEAFGDNALVETVPGSLAGRARDWRQICAQAKKLTIFSYADDNARQSFARRFYEAHFTPHVVQIKSVPKPDGPARDAPPRTGEEGLFTGYFEPVYEAFEFETVEFSAPVYARPADLVMVDLGRFRADLAGVRIAGSIEDGRLKPYPDHREINDGALRDRATVIAWMRPTDLLFMQIQGSGRIRFRNGETLRLGYDGQNGHPYTPVGRILIEKGEVARERMSMQAIRRWLDRASPEDARALREANASYVFFRELTEAGDPKLGPLGAQSVQLTAGRSLAVDRRYHALGLPVWVSIDEGQPGIINDFRRLFIAQDTGGAIKGPIRGDIFVGTGPRAESVAGVLNARGAMTVLLPNPVAQALARRDRGPLSATLSAERP